MGFISWFFGCGADNMTPPKQPASASSNVSSQDGSDYKIADVFSGLRSQVFTLKLKDLGLPEKQPIAVLMETGFQEAIVSLVVIADGSTSLYFSNGGGIIGAGEHDSVRAFSKNFLADVSAVADSWEIVKEAPLPKQGQVRFHLISSKGIQSIEATEQDLGHNRHRLSPEFHAGHAVIAMVREYSDSEK